MDALLQQFFNFDIMSRALPLDMVERIESVPMERIEYAGGRPLMQYRGELLPLKDHGNVLPDLVSNTVEVVKLTSIASVVALPEMLYSADMARSVTFNASPIVLAAAIYLVMLWPVVRLISRLERRMAS